MAETNGIASTYDLMYHFKHFLTESTDTIGSNTTYQQSITAYTTSLANAIWRFCGQSYTNAKAQYVPSKSYMLNNYSYSYYSGTTGSSGGKYYLTYIRIKNENNYSPNQAVKISDISYGTKATNYNRPIKHINFIQTNLATCYITYENYYPTKSYTYLLGPFVGYYNTGTGVLPAHQYPHYYKYYCYNASHSEQYDMVNMYALRQYLNGTTTFRCHAYLNFEYEALREYDMYAYVESLIPINYNTQANLTSYAKTSKHVKVYVPQVHSAQLNEDDLQTYIPINTSITHTVQINETTDNVDYALPLFKNIGLTIYDSETTYYKTDYLLNDAIDNLPISIVGNKALNITFTIKSNQSSLSYLDIVNGNTNDGATLSVGGSNLLNVFQPNTSFNYHTTKKYYFIEQPTSISLSYTGALLVDEPKRFRVDVNPITAYAQSFYTTANTTYFKNYALETNTNNDFLTFWWTPKKSGTTTVKANFKYDNAITRQSSVPVDIHYSLYNFVHVTTSVEQCTIESTTNDTNYFTSDTLTQPHNTALDGQYVDLVYLKIPYSTETYGDTYFKLYVRFVYNVNCYATIRYWFETPNNTNTLTLTKINSGSDNYGEHNVTVNREIRVDSNNIKMYDVETDDELNEINNAAFATFAKIIGDASYTLPATIALRCNAENNNIAIDFRVNYGNHVPQVTPGEDEYQIEFEVEYYSSSQFILTCYVSSTISSIQITSIVCNTHNSQIQYSSSGDYEWLVTLHEQNNYDDCMYYINYRVNNETTTYTKFISLNKLL